MMNERVGLVVTANLNRVPSDYPDGIFLSIRLCMYIWACQSVNPALNKESPSGLFYSPRTTRPVSNLAATPVSERPARDQRSRGIS
jgi:hypothetical protein